MANKNLKQTNLLNKKKANAKASTKETGSMKAIKALASSQNDEKVTYQDYEGNKHTRSITLSDPGIATATKAIDFMQAGHNSSDFPNLFQLVMNKVIVSPQLSFAKEQKSLPKALKSKTVSHKNKDGVDVSLHYVWPGYREAVQIVTEVGRPNGAFNMTGVLNDLNAYVFKDNNGKSVNNSYWDAGGYANGLGMKAINEAIEYLGAVLDHDGFNSVVQKGLSFLTTSLR